MSANSLSSQRIADFSLISLVSLISVLAWFYAPIFFIIAALMVPVSLAVLVRRQDLKYGLASLLLVFGLVSLITGKPPDVFFLLLQTGPLGLLLGLLFKNHVTFGKALIVTIFFMASVLIVMLFINYLVIGNNPLILNEEYKAFFSYERQLVNNAVGPGGLAEGIEQSTLNELNSMLDRLEGIWPVLALTVSLVWSVLSAFACYMITRYAMITLQYQVPAVIPFTRWRLPWYAIWVIIAGLSLMLSGDWLHVSSLPVAGKAILWTMGFILLIIGFSVFVFYFRRWKAPLPLKILNAILMAIYLPVTALVLVAAGTLDTIINIRRLNPEGQIPEEE